MHFGIAIDFGGRGLQDLCAQAFGETEHVNGPVHARLRGLHGIVLVMHWRSGTSQIVNFINFHVERKSHVMAQQLEMFVIAQMFDIALRAGEKIVNAEDIRVIVQQAFA
jgi:hypothetical protein